MKIKVTTPTCGVPSSFVTQPAPDVTGVLCGFDRLPPHGHLASPAQEPGKCLHSYFYFLHEQLGLLHLRLQTWFPFALHLGLNGRHWLPRQLDQAQAGYVQCENC